MRCFIQDLSLNSVSDLFPVWEWLISSKIIGALPRAIGLKIRSFDLVYLFKTCINLNGTK